MFKVKYYQHTRKFYENIQLHTNEIHLTQSASLSYFLRKRNKDTCVLGYGSFIEKLFPRWYHPHTEVYLKSKLRKYLQENTEDHRWFYYEKYLTDYYESLRFIIEFGGLNLYEVPELNHKQRLLVPMIKEYMKEPIVREYLMERASLTKGKVLQRLKIQGDVQTIFIHHFDYVDARRMMLFQLLKQIGFKVVFYIPYNPTYPDLFQSWNTIYKNITNGTSETWECVEASTVEYGGKLAHYLDKNDSLNERDREDISFLTFAHPTEFKEYIEKHPLIQNQHEVIAIFEANLNPYINQTPRDHFYATSYGKFFLCLQNCKKTEDGIKITYDDYVNMMGSGWVQTGNTNGSQAMTLLIDLKDYMEGIESFQDILERLDALVYLREFGDAFDDLAKEQTGKDKLKKYLSNPFRAFSYLNSSRYSITVKQLIDCTKDLARKLNQLLLKERTARNVREYIQDLQTIYDGVKEKWEPEVAKKFEKIFSVQVPDDWEFEKEELYQFLSFYFASEEEPSEGKIGNIDELIGKAFTTDRIHVTDLSLETFPWKSPPLPPLLNHSWLKKCIYQSFISNNKNIRLNALVVDYFSRELTRKRAIYFIYHLIAFAKGSITFSYIDELRENDEPSIYLTILEELYKKDASLPVSDEVEYEWEEDVPLPRVEVNKEKYNLIPDLLWLDSDFCHKKFFLNAFVEQHPIYENDFHQQVVFAAVGKLLSEQGEGEQEIRNVVYPLFPQWTNALKQNLIDLASAKGLRSYKSFDNLYYPKAMKRLQVLYSRYEVTQNWKAKYQYDHDTFKPSEHIKEFQKSIMGNEMKAKAGHHCRMCPFLHVCEEGEYVVDANDY